VTRLHPNASCLVLVLLAVGAAGCGLPGQPDPKARPIAPDRVTAFDALYSQNCAGCHGADGKLGPAPPLNDPLFRAIVPVETVEQVVAAGRPGTLMPAFSSEHGGPLTPAQVAVLVNEVKGIPYRVRDNEPDGVSSAMVVVRVPDGEAPAWGALDPAPEGTPPYLAPKAGGDPNAGRDRFLTACASCHGDNGQAPPKDSQPALAIHDPAFLNLISDQALRRIVITGRADLRMPDFAHHGKAALTAADVTNLVALLSSWRRETSKEGAARPQGRQQNATPEPHP
jgi:cytochrome c oxidase cbb3-type subunit III